MKIEKNSLSIKYKTSIKDFSCMHDTYIRIDFIEAFYQIR